MDHRHKCKCEIRKLLDKNTGAQGQDLSRFRQKKVMFHTKVQPIKEKTDKLDLIKIKNICSAKACY